MKQYKWITTYSFDCYKDSPIYTYEYIGTNGILGFYEFCEHIKNKAYIHNITVEQL